MKILAWIVYLAGVIVYSIVWSAFILLFLGWLFTIVSELWRGNTSIIIVFGVMVLGLLTLVISVCLFDWSKKKIWG